MTNLEILQKEMEERFLSLIQRPEDYEILKELITQTFHAGEAKGRDEYRDHLRFLYRWISRLNGDKPHDRPETS